MLRWGGRECRFRIGTFCVLLRTVLRISPDDGKMQGGVRHKWGLSNHVKRRGSPTRGAVHHDRSARRRTTSGSTRQLAQR